MVAVTTSPARLHGSSSYEEDRLFTRILMICYAIFFVVSMIVTFVKLPQIERAKLEALPPQLARMVMENKKVPPPVPEIKKEEQKPEPKPEEKEKPEEKPDVKEKEKEKPQEKVKPKEVKKPKEVTKPKATAKSSNVDNAKGNDSGEKTVEQARVKAAKSGVLEFADDLADMREDIDLGKINQTDNLSRNVGQATRTERSIITGRATQTSGGISTAGFSRDGGGSALSGRETTRIKDAAGKDLSGRETTRVKSAAVEQKIKNPVKKSSTSGRSDESVRKIFDRNRGALFAIYNRALRDDSSLQGKVTIELVIESGGQVSSCRIVSSELKNPGLEAKLVSRIKLINFGAESVTRSTINYSIDFLPY